tara:strand:+ start:2841 stop:3200 length:360 start_codon:yes stop_codon:yes gene_type:complete
MATKQVALNNDGSRKKPISESSGRKGDFAEYYAITWLWDNGYEVFPNAGSSGPIDMVAFKDGEITLIDVKTFYTDNPNTASMTASSARTQEQKNLGVVLLGFAPETRKLRWINHHEKHV